MQPQHSWDPFFFQKRQPELFMRNLSNTQGFRCGKPQLALSTRTCSSVIFAHKVQSPEGPKEPAMVRGCLTSPQSCRNTQNPQDGRNSCLKAGPQTAWDCLKPSCRLHKQDWQMRAQEQLRAQENAQLTLATNLPATSQNVSEPLRASQSTSGQ